MENFKIDEENRLYIFPHEDLKESERLKVEALEFIRKTFTFDESNRILVDRLGSLSMVVETHKLKALGEKAKLEHAAERKLKKSQELMQKINERKIQLEALVSEHQSLMRVEQEQQINLEKIKNNKM